LIKIAVIDSQKEEALIRQALSKIYEIHAIRNESRIQARNSGQKEMLRKGQLMKMLQINSQTLPLYVSKPGEKIPPLVGCIPANSEYTAKSGDMVAALTKVLDKGSDEENWIMAEVINYSHHTQKYEVHDIDEEQKPRHILSKRRVIPLPLFRANPETDAHALFQKGTVVMALYPQTTCFYKAIINDLPASASKDYEVLFEDSTYPNGYSDPMFVPQRFVIKQRKS
jgi:SAGA-associated factor 29